MSFRPSTASLPSSREPANTERDDACITDLVLNHGISLCRRQPNATTFASQSRQWQALILSYCRFHRIFRIELSESNLARESATDTAELFGNAAVKSGYTTLPVQVIGLMQVG